MVPSGRERTGQREAEGMRMKGFVFGASVTAAMLLGWGVGEWMQASFGLVASFGLWGLLAVGVFAWARSRG